MKCRTVLWDFDGTLTDTLTSSVLEILGDELIRHSIATG